MGFINIDVHGLQELISHLKLALSIHIHPNFTTHRTSSLGMPPVAPSKRVMLLFGDGVVEFAAEHGIVRSGSR